jgi:ABC-type molybdate transport system substrate-binding protein
MNIVKTLALLSLLTGILVLASYLIIGSAIGAFIGLGIAAITNLGAWFYSHQIALAVYNAQPLSREQAQKIEPIVKKLGDRALLPVPSLYLSNQVKLTTRTRTIISTVIILAALGLTFAPLPGLEQSIIVVSGTELQEPLQVLATEFEQANPQIKIDLEFQGSQDLVNRYIDRQNDFNPTILIPAEGEILQELSDRYSAQENSEAFYGTPQPIAKTMLVGIAWQERGQILFPDGRFQWQNLEQAMQQRNWATIGGQANWGSFDLAIADPTRSNSGQLTLSLWAQSLNSSFNDPRVDSLFSLIKRSVYQPARSTDILLQEFISRGANDADVATVYESIALYRWSQAQTTQGIPYQIYYLDPTIETIATAAIVLRNVDRQTAEAAKHFLNFLTQTEQQQVFIRYGFRPVVGNIDLRSVANSPWKQNIPGAKINPPIQILSPPNTQIRGEIQRLWQRAN